MSFPPQPAPDQDSAGFWSALDAGELRLQYSPAADRWQFPPLERCRHTGGLFEWRRIRPGGAIVSFIVQHRPVTGGFEALLPFPIALVEPDDAPGVRLPLRIAGSHGERVAVGGRVRMEVVPLPGGDSKVVIARLEDG
jgi:uncharacterized OB-fold protein